MFFWRTFFVLAGAAILFAVILVTILQLPISKDYFRAEVETVFNNQFEGNLNIEAIDGFLPFTATLQNGRIYSPNDSLRSNPVIRFEQAQASVDWWQLLQKNFVISSLEITSPEMNLFQENDVTNVGRAFAVSTQRVRSNRSSENETPIFFDNINIFAPSISVEHGKFTTDESISLPENLNLPPLLSLENLNFTIFLEITEDQIFFELPHFITEIPDSPYGFLQLNGQFYNDNEFFELNRFRISTEIGHADFSFEASQVDLRSGNIRDQFLNAQYGFEITESSLNTSLIQQFISTYPDFQHQLELTLESEGDANEYYLDSIRATVGESSLLISGMINNLFEDNISYHAQLDNMVIHPHELLWVSETYFDNAYSLDRYQLSTIRGELEGEKDSVAVDFDARTEAGSFLLDGNMAFTEQPVYDFSFEVDSLDITPFLGDSTQVSILQGGVTLLGSGFGNEADFESTLDLSHSIILGYNVDTFEALFNYTNQTLRFNVNGADTDLLVSANGEYGRKNGQQRLITDGRVQNLDIKNFTNEFYADSTNFNSTFSSNVEWTSIDDITGRVSFEMEESIINQDTLRPHQLYADISDTDTSRRLRFTSSFFDGEMNGDLNPQLITDVRNHWKSYLKQQIDTQFLFTEDSLSVSPTTANLTNDQSLNLSVEMAIKDLSLLRMYVPDLPELESNARFTTSIDATKDRFLITGNIYDPHIRFGNYSANNVNSDFTASFRHGVQLKESSTIDLQITSAQTTIQTLQLKESRFEISMRDDSVHVYQRLERLNDDLTFETNSHAKLLEDRLNITIENLDIGSSIYRWSSEGNPVISYSNIGKWDVDSFVMTSDSDYLKIDGTYSNSPEDIVNYEIENFDLQRISDLINGRVRFSGIMNGDFQTQSLKQIPSFQGNFRIDEGRIQERLIGDLTFDSELNTGENRFDTTIRLFTNPEKYPDYIRNNDGIGQDLEFNGYFRIPGDNIDPDDELFYFDADFREIDMWITTFIVPNIITDMEGKASGQGSIHGTLNDFDFESRFEVTDTYGKPVFTDVDYTLNGELTFNKSDGLIFHDVDIRDSRSGIGVLSGTVDLDNFSPTTYIDLTLDLDNLHFLNSSSDPDIPFYGSVYGTGQATITGTNFAPVLRTTGPLLISSNSRVSIPLEPETAVEQEQRFIQFVESFNQPFLDRTPTGTDNENGDDDEIELTFMERFTMDLQFQANNPITVRMIFDEVTSDILSANGTGQIRILLEDQDVSVFGRFNITGGEYQFVSGDIFTRRFTLQQGGTISWSGDLVDADLDVTAVYRARPNIGTLLSSTGTGAGIDQSQRIPVELVLQIGGNILQVENEFFFRMPSGIDAISDPTITAQINNLNQNEDEKLIQATSILISGNFISPTSAQGLGVTESFSGAAVVSPFVTSQIINPLLSNQINSLLRSDITFDIDFNLNAFNEVDLGVALRLFDDRIVLRREGQITGEQSDIGDLGATYRINRTFSVTAFHRQDHTLSYTSDVDSRQAQEMNGIGVEAQVQFNTWQNLRNQVANAFRKLFGIREKETEDEDDQDRIAENKQINDQ